MSFDEIDLTGQSGQVSFFSVYKRSLCQVACDVAGEKKGKRV